MKRRDFLIYLGTAAILAPSVSQAQVSERTVLEALKTKFSDVIESYFELEIALSPSIEWTEGFSDGDSCTFDDF